MAKRVDSGERRPGRRGRVRQSPRNNLPRFAHIKPDNGESMDPQSLLDEVIRSQAWGLRELARIALDEADGVMRCSECDAEIPVPGPDPKARTAAVKALLDYGLKMMKQSDVEGLDEIRQAISQGVGKVADEAQRRRSSRDIQREVAGKLE